MAVARRTPGVVPGAPHAPKREGKLHRQGSPHTPESVSQPTVALASRGVEAAVARAAPILGSFGASPKPNLFDCFQLSFTYFCVRGKSQNPICFEVVTPPPGQGPRQYQLEQEGRPNLVPKLKLEILKCFEVNTTSQDCRAVRM